MSAAAVAATTVEPATAAAMEATAATTTVESTAAVSESAAMAAVKTAATGKATPASEPAATVKATTTVEPSAAEAATVVATASEAPTAEPRASANEDAAYEVVRTVVSVGCAGIRVITVISVTADGCATVVAAHWTNSDAHRPLRIRVRRSDQGECQAGTHDSQIF